MSSGNVHESINFYTLTVFSFFLFFIGVISHSSLLFLLECCLCWVHGMFHTYYVTPDNDTHSKSTKRLGLIGSIIDWIFPHHGLLHNLLFWIAFYTVIYVRVFQIYNYSAWWLIGGVLAICLHVWADKVSTAWKRFWGKIKRTLNPFRWIKKVF